MYRESTESVGLMTLNTYYQDRRYANKKLMFLFNAKEKAKGFSTLLKNVAKIGKQGFPQTWLQIRAFFCPRLIIDHYLPYEFDHRAEIDYQPRHTEWTGRIAVYTSVFGNYDQIAQPLFQSPLCDYYAITDQELPPDGIWKKYDTSSIPGFDEMDAYHKSKYCKMFPHILFPDHAYSVWMDGNVLSVADPVPLVDRMDDRHFMATFHNPLHDCIYTEARYIIVQGFAKVQELERQIACYRQEGFPAQFGMREFSVIVRRHHDPVCVDLMEQWWTQVNTYTMRDQISFPYLLWKNGRTIDTVQLLGKNWRHNPRFICRLHNWHIRYVGNKS